MAAIIPFLIFMVVAFIIAVNRGQNANLAGGGGWGGGYVGPLANGKPARAILLQVDSTGWKRSYGGVRYEIRNARVDIEEPGELPYEIQTQIYIPGNLVRDALPGSTMEVRVDRNSQNMVVIVGPDVGYVQGAVRTS